MSDLLLDAAEAALAERLDQATLRRAPASLVAITHHGRVIAVAAHGEPRRDGAPATRRTVFRIASMSKSFLSATALALRDEGLLDLHAPVTQWVPEVGDARIDGHPVGDRITLSMLMANSAGLVEDNPWGDDHLGESRAFMRDVVSAGLSLSAQPGTQYQYSNLGQSLIGRAIESVTGRPVEDVIRERLLDPLGLSATRASADLYPSDADLAHGFRTFDDGESFIHEPYVGTGALGCIGSMFSTVDDIGSWMHFLSSAFDDDLSRPSSSGPLRAASRREMQVARTLISPAVGQFGERELDGAGYGYGLVVEHDRRFGRVVQHSGGLPGFSSHMRWHPASGIGVVAFGNSDSFGAGRIAGLMLHDVLRAVDAPAEVVRPWPQTLAAAGRVDELLRSGRALQHPESWADAGELARNVLRDVPADVRTRRLRAATDEVGVPDVDAPPLATRIVSAADASALRWTVPCATGALVCDLRMVGLSEPIVQALEVRVAGERGKPRDEVDLVTDHHRVAAVEHAPVR
ncbi:serine hydrolase domain-containing protein [Microbacterium sp. NPDC089321]|uniref:serine hydrolase domain-containing protein n=1 Tax=Microbacterium sp. NPDC089321 TaxID=3155183 RepID=UPI00341D3692